MKLPKPTNKVKPYCGPEVGAVQFLIETQLGKSRQGLPFLVWVTATHGGLAHFTCKCKTVYRILKEHEPEVIAGLGLEDHARMMRERYGDKPFHVCACSGRLIE